MRERSAEIEQLTRSLREGSDPFWARLRKLLSERDVDPSTSLLVECFPDDPSFEFGLVVTDDRRVFQFGFNYLNRSVENGTLTEWEDLTSRFESSPHRDVIAIALAMQSAPE